ncbi:GNAT family N-acetyltransferase [Halorubrum halodurans]|uniref:GNAT family N-acetyltransferase n=1 Tax=Halorubrum halodurans TaxID=1383851 RepID=A0A256IGG7_9EURY|nr:GNAT family N-acetyltransferase [Halorubrum halodurans]OYR55640.1 GNAT family N-acetyltransferase [Halorubrum halodurans]
MDDPTTTDVRELTTDAEFEAAYPILRELRDHLDRAGMEATHERMREEGYRLFGRYDGGTLVAVAGVSVGTNFYLGRHVFVHDLVTTESRRSEGHGSALLAFLHEWARDRDCETVELESGLWRDEAHRFYEAVGYEKYCYSFTYDLDAEGRGG